MMIFLKNEIVRGVQWLFFGVKGNTHLAIERPWGRKIGEKYYTRPRARCKVFDESIRLVCIECSISRTIDLYIGPGSDNTHKCFVLLLLNIFFSTFFIHTSLS